MEEVFKAFQSQQIQKVILFGSFPVQIVNEIGDTYEVKIPDSIYHKLKRASLTPANPLEAYVLKNLHRFVGVQGESCMVYPLFEEEVLITPAPCEMIKRMGNDTL